MIEIKTDTSRMESAIAEFCALTRKSVSEVYKKQGGIAVGQLIGVTPPAHAETLNADGGVTLSAKKAGESRIAADIAKLFPTTKKPEETAQGMIDSGYKWQAANGRRYPVAGTAYTLAKLKTFHAAARNPRTGRTRTGYGALMAVTTAAARRAYIAQEVKKVGLLSAGWLNAARELKTTGRFVPAWIKRHGPGPGGANVVEGAGRISVHIYNSNSWFSGGWEARLSYVVSRAEHRIKADINREMDRRAKAAERRMGR